VSLHRLCCCEACVDLAIAITDEDDNSYGASITPDPVVTLAWNAHVPGGGLTVTDYTLQRRAYGTGSFADVVSAGTSLGVDDDTISSGVRYEWRVKVTMDDASVAYSCATDWCTCGIPADMGTPSASLDGADVDVTWTTPASPAGPFPSSATASRIGAGSCRSTSTACSWACATPGR
jgi:hypothetical protein